MLIVIGNLPQINQIDLKLPKSTRNRPEIDWKSTANRPETDGVIDWKVTPDMPNERETAISIEFRKEALAPNAREGPGHFAAWPLYCLARRQLCW